MNNNCGYFSSLYFFIHTTQTLMTQVIDIDQELTAKERSTLFRYTNDEISSFLSAMAIESFAMATTIVVTVVHIVIAAHVAFLVATTADATDGKCYAILDSGLTVVAIVSIALDLLFVVRQVSYMVGMWWHNIGVVIGVIWYHVGRYDRAVLKTELGLRVAHFLCYLAVECWFVTCERESAQFLLLHAAFALYNLMEIAYLFSIYLRRMDLGISPFAEKNTAIAPNSTPIPISQIGNYIESETRLDLESQV